PTTKCGPSRRRSARRGRCCCARRRCASGSRGSTTCTCRGPACSCTRTIRSPFAGSSRCASTAIAHGSTDMHARVVAPAAGARWLLEGWRIFRAAPLGWVAIVMAYLLIVLVASSIPGLGIAAIALATPGFSVSFMAVSRSASAAGTVHLGQLFSGFREGLRGQLLLGLVYFACVATAI